MANLKEVRNRIASVNSTQQITKAMKMVAAAKLRRAQDNILQMRPYAQKLGEMLRTVSAGAEAAQENPFKQERPIEKVLMVVITSDRGLCGAFNANVSKAATAVINEKYAAQKRAGNVHILSIGKKGGEFFTRRGYKVNALYEDTFTRLSFGVVRQAADEIMNAFLNNQYDIVEIVYNEFKNVATQIVRVEQFLPIVENMTQESATPGDYIFEPSEEEIIKELIPKSLKIQLYRAVLESNASEHGARMTAMDKATDNAGELLKNLRIEYNRSRQAAITTEILEIVAGAEALAGN
ncbi:ATP synthase F1 subunit gamma [Siphonobacter sp. BAB-5385]|uniref:ATP synthase F1 subunit gamma n=1 Tax=unclassified Siphonobacter TaxID=2635712 RepID=UPI000B9DD267|nr:MULTISPECIES: ATP synthase F1 subunit gamma [unclassified Siphonobacter]OZI08321.1 ATP synthase F1 subunit gamma [Siphonobacter sp. BAB-5385]PMD97483.1 ATP synthase F1 subunit gamma [Siphonobacter sp. BAB-5405]